MSIFSKKEEPEVTPQAAPVEKPEGEVIEQASQPGADRISDLERTVSTMAESMNRFTNTLTDAASRPTPVASPTPTPIEDLSDEELRLALQEGGDRAFTASETRRKADMERLRRSQDEQISSFQAAGTGALNSLAVKFALKDKPYYQSDTKVREQVDAQLKALPAGAIIQGETIDAVYNMVVGAPENMERLYAAKREAETRQAQEAAAAASGKAPGSGQLRDDEGGDHVPSPHDLTPDADKLLQSRNNGAGITADDFARKMPATRGRNDDGKFETRRHQNWEDRMKRYQKAQKEFDEEQFPQYFGVK